MNSYPILALQRQMNTWGTREVQSKPLAIGARPPGPYPYDDDSVCVDATAVGSRRRQERRAQKVLPDPGQTDRQPSGSRDSETALFLEGLSGQGPKQVHLLPT